MFYQQYPSLIIHFRNFSTFSWFFYLPLSFLCFTLLPFSFIVSILIITRQTRVISLTFFYSKFVFYFIKKLRRTVKFQVFLFYFFVSVVGEPMSAAEGTRLCTRTRSPSLTHSSTIYYWTSLMFLENFFKPRAGAYNTSISRYMDTFDTW